MIGKESYGVSSVPLRTFWLTQTKLFCFVGTYISNKSLEISNRYTIMYKELGKLIDKRG